MPAQQQERAPSQETEIAYVDPFPLFPQHLFTPYNPSALISRKGYRIIDRMRKDEQIRAALSFKAHAVIAAGWGIESPLEQAEDWEVTQFVRDILHKMKGTVEGTIEQLLDDGLSYGHTLVEKIFTPELKLEQIRIIRPHEIHYQQEVFGNVFEIEQERPEGRILLGPMEKCPLGL